ncbi:anti-sigma factor [Streptomyces sp. NPDC056628]|uniref:anti-sigma factor n=1 Tax=Streptomyces sp. NPDC056628 TaxID=3345882 RepID=UPI0036BFCB34
MPADLPALCGDTVLELSYAAPSGDLRPTGLLPGTGDRSARVLNRPLGQTVAVGITVEPAGGSRRPTTEPLGIIPSAPSAAVTTARHGLRRSTANGPVKRRCWAVARATAPGRTTCGTSHIPRRTWPTRGSAAVRAA